MLLQLSGVCSHRHNLCFHPCACSLIAQRGLPRLAVRRAMHGVSTLGCAASMMPLALGGSTLSPVVATMWLVAFQCCYSFSFGGFHGELSTQHTKLRVWQIKSTAPRTNLLQHFGIQHGLGFVSPVITAESSTSAPRAQWLCQLFMSTVSVKQSLPSPTQFSCGVQLFKPLSFLYLAPARSLYAGCSAKRRGHHARPHQQLRVR